MQFELKNLDSASDMTLKVHNKIVYTQQTQCKYCHSLLHQ